MSRDIHWEADIECTSCGGTGLYRGLPGRGGAAAVCLSCSGSGKMHLVHEYKAFEGRKERTDVTRVFKTSGGYVLSDKNTITDDGKVIHFSEAGCSYKDWLNGAEPKPIRDLHCPLQHFGQGTEKGEWLKEKGPCRMPGRVSLGGYLSTCAVKYKDECWAQFDRGEFFKE